jgi:flagellin-specific chaperone FliS
VSDIEFAKYLIEKLGPFLREAGQAFPAEDVEDAGARLLRAAEIVHTLLD